LIGKKKAAVAAEPPSASSYMTSPRPIVAVLMIATLAVGLTVAMALKSKRYYNH
jgi:hypothetical protein